MTSISNNSLTLSIGIDPGINGGIAVVSSIGRLIWAHPMPATQWDTWTLLDDFVKWKDTPDRRYAHIEQINPAAFGWDKAANAKLYASFREMMMVLTACQIPFEPVLATKWQSTLGISPRKKTESDSKWKIRLRSKCQQLFPGFNKGITKERALKVCDAILIAEYCRRLHSGEK